MGIYERDYIEIDTKTVGSFSTRVYGWMALGLAFTAAVAYFVFRTGLYLKLMPLWWVFAFGTFGVAVAITRAMNRLSIGGVIGLFMTYAGLEGLMFGTILPAFAASFGGGVIWSAFATAAAVFGVATLYGMCTRSDLTSMGRILTFGLMGLIGVSFMILILSFFIPMTWAHLFISWIGLVLFVGLTAYDAQTIRRMSAQADPQSVMAYKLSMVMALKMYINVIMIFWYLLQIFSSGSRR